MYFDHDVARALLVKITDKTCFSSNCVLRRVSVFITRHIAAVNPRRKTNFEIQWNLGSRTPLITNKSVQEQIFRKKKTSRVTNTQAGNNGWRQGGSIGGRASVAV
jgi:hypothetical protein